MSVLSAGRPSQRKEKAIESVTSDSEVTRFNMNIDKNLYKRIKIFALENDVSVTNLMKKSVIEYMSKNSNTQPEKDIF